MTRFFTLLFTPANLVALAVIIGLWFALRSIPRKKPKPRYPEARKPQRNWRDNIVNKN